jgi:hypothetical protein
MYGTSHVWGTVFLQAGKEFTSSLSTLHLHLLKGTLGVKRSTTNWHCQKASRYQRVSELQKRVYELSRSAR